MKKTALLFLTTTLFVSMIGTSALAATTASKSPSLTSSVNKKVTATQTTTKSVTVPATAVEKVVSAADLKQLNLSSSDQATPVIIQKLETVWRNNQGQKQTVDLYLYGMKSTDSSLPFYRQIGLAAIDNETGHITYQNNVIQQGMEPKMEWISQDQFDAAYLLISADSGGSGGVGYYAIARYADENWENLLKDFSNGWEVSTTLETGFVAEVLLDNQLHFEYQLGSTGKQNLIDQGYYNKSGKVLKQNPDYMLLNSFSGIEVSEEDGMPIFTAEQTLAVGDETNRIGVIQTKMVLSDDGTKLDIVKVKYIHTNATERSVPVE